MPSPEVRAVGTITSNVNAISPGLPAGTVQGDLLIMIVETKGTEGELTASGWTNNPQGSKVQGNTRLNVLYRIATGSADATTTNDTGDHQIGRIVGIKAGTFDPIEPFNASASGTQASTKSVSIPGATTTLDECLILAMASGSLPDEASTAQFGAATNASLTSITERVDNSNTAGDGGSVYAVTGIQAKAGTYNATTCTATTEAERGVISLAIAPPRWAKTGQKSKAYTENVSDSTTLERPSTSSSGDLLVALVNFHDGSITSPTGFTAGWTKDIDEASSSDRWMVFTRLDDGSTNLKLEWTGQRNVQGMIFAYHPRNGGVPALDTSTVQVNSASKTLKTKGLKTAAADELNITAIVETTGKACTPPAGTVEVSDEGTESTHAMHVAQETIHTAGTETGERNFTVDDSTAVGSVGVQIAFKSNLTQSVSVGQPSETDSALSPTRLKTKAVGQVSAVETAQKITPIRTRSINQVSASDQALAITSRHTRAVGQAAEADSATAVFSRKARSAGQASESDSAQAITAVKLRVVTVGQAAEADSAQALISSKAKTTGQASEAAVAQPITASHRVTASPASEADSSQPLASSKAKATGQALSSESAQAIRAARVYPVGQATALEAARPLASLKAALLSLVLEADSAQSTSHEKRTGIGQASEADSAAAPAPAKRLSVGGAEEEDSAEPINAAGTETILVEAASEADHGQPITARKLVAVGQASDLETASPARPSRTHALGCASEGDSSHGVHSAKAQSAQAAAEGNAAQPITALKRTPVAPAAEADSVGAIRVLKLRAVGAATEAETARPVLILRTLTVGQALEAAQAQALAALKLKPISQATETDQSQHVLLGNRRIPLNPAAESDVSLPITLSGEPSELQLIDGAVALLAMTDQPATAATLSDAAVTTLTVSDVAVEMAVSDESETVAALDDE